ncbi:MAG: hypothetical protein V4714_06095 [Bacteroidota bacterium]
MTFLSQLSRSIPLTISGLYLAYQVTKEPTGIGVFDGFWLIALAIITAILLVRTWRKDRAAYVETRSVKSYLSSLIGIILPALVFLSLRTNNPTVLYAIFDRGFEGASIKFRQDGTYQLGNISELGTQYVYGQYQFQDSLILLDKSDLADVIESKRLAIRAITRLGGAGNDTLLYQIDSTGKVIPNSITFALLEDNRKMK